MDSHGRNDLRQLLKKNAEMLNISPTPKTNDVLVHCCVEDVKWVKEHLLVQLENTLKRQCYLSYRDDKELGKDATDAINDDINSAANLLLIISQKYLAYAWHAYYVKMAHRKSIVEEIPLAVIFLDDVKGLTFHQFCQVQGCLVHHVLLQWEKGATKKQQERFWQELANKYLDNKNVKRGEEFKTSRKTVVSVTVHQKAEFFHSKSSDVVPERPYPTRKQDPYFDSKMLDSQIIVEEQDGDRDGFKPEVDEKDLSTEVKVMACKSNLPFYYDSQTSGTTEEMANGSQISSVSGTESCDSYMDNIRRSHDKSKNNYKNNRCAERYESNFCVDGALCRDVSGSSVLNGPASKRKHTHRYEGGMNGDMEVPVCEEITGKGHLQEMKDDIGILLQCLEETEAGTELRHGRSVHKSFEEGV